MNIKHALLWLIGIIFLAVVVLYLGLEEITAALNKAEISVLTFLAALQLITLSVTAFQWQFMLGKSGQKITLGKSLAINLAGNYVESITPSVKIGGESAKIYLFHRNTDLNYSQLTGILLALKYFSLLPFMILITGTLVLAFSVYELPWLVYLAFFVFLLFFTGIAWIHFKGGNGEVKSQRESKKTLFNSIIGFVRKASIYSRSLTGPGESMSLLVLSGFIWILYPAKTYLVTVMLGLEVGLPAIIATYIAYLVSMVPLLPGGLGSFEGSMALVLSFSGIIPAEGLAVALLTRLITFWFPLLLSTAAAGYLALTNNYLAENESMIRVK